ncbi:MAG: translation initiation factor IF-2 [Chloroflexi bacterium]|nr:translation initiation factor IF-2 [Chloroflexota bacterium]
MNRGTPAPSSQEAAPVVPARAEPSVPVALRELKVPRALTVQRLAQLMQVTPIELIKQLMRNSVMANINQTIDYATAAPVVGAFGFRAVLQEEAATKTLSAKVEAEEDLSLLQPRPPVVTILGHVDHGKTTLLDAIRKTRVAEREAGGITQHIGAYQVDYRGQRITFLDTPGHEAFTAMRARGAEATDIAVLVVAANDGIMPQTIEAINHVKAAKVPIVVAINKMDLPDADAERVKRQLADHGLLIEEWGGDVVAVPVSAKAGTGLEDLLENILVMAEVAELKANPQRAAAGVVIEASLDKSRGPVSTLLVKTGTLRMGDYVVAGTTRGRVKALVSDAGKRIKQAGPATPAGVLGLSELPQVGDTFAVVESEQAGRSLVEERQRGQAQTRRQVTLEEIFTRIRSGEAEELRVIVKADVQGSVEAIVDALSHLSSDKAQLRVIHAASGSITESDIFLAVASQAIILGFNITLEPGARRVAEAEHVEVRFYTIIYQLLEDIQNTLKGLVQPTVVDTVLGRGVVRAVFTRSRQGKVAGVAVTEGRLMRNAFARVLRQGQLLHDGPIASLRRFKEDAREVAAGLECGMAVEGFDDFQEGDVLEAHRQERPGQ